MTLRLILTRHAKSDWATPQVGDVRRPLNKRGQRNAETIGRWMVENGYIPETALVSSAARTQETFERLQLPAQGLNSQSLDALYHAGPERILQVIKSATGKTVLLLAHNPGIGEFSERFADIVSDHPDFWRYPTGATTVFQVKATSWKDIAWGENAIEAFVIPRELESKKAPQ